jgi:hypothetical protein
MTFPEMETFAETVVQRPLSGERIVNVMSFLYRQDPA